MQNDDFKQDPLQQGDDFFSPILDEEKLDNDGASPAAAPRYQDDRAMPPDYPTTDTDIDAGGRYFAGTADEAGYTPNPEDADDTIFPLEQDDDVN